MRVVYTPTRLRLRQPAPPGPPPAPKVRYRWAVLRTRDDGTADIVCIAKRRVALATYNRMYYAGVNVRAERVPVLTEPPTRITVLRIDAPIDRETGTLGDAIESTWFAWSCDDPPADCEDLRGYLGLVTQGTDHDQVRAWHKERVATWQRWQVPPQ